MRILLVDDERFAREEMEQALAEMALPSDTGIDVATDGVEAFDLALNHAPDLLISDVRMPRCDGIELAKRILELTPDCRIIFLSNYSDKPYLREAIRLRAVEYIDKPIDWPRFRDAVRQAMEQVRDSARARQMEASLSRTVADARGMLLHRWSQVISHKHSDCEAVRRQCEQYGITDMFDAAYRCLLFRTDDETVPDIRLEGVQSLPPDFQSDGSAVQYFYAPDPALLSDAALSETWRQLPPEARIGMAAGTVSANYRTAYESYRSAVRALDRLFFRSEPYLESAADASAGETMTLDEQTITALEQPIAELNAKSVNAMLDTLFAGLHAKPGTPVMNIRNYFCKVADHMLRISAADHLEFHHTHSSGELYRAVWEAKNLDEIESTVRGWIRDMLACDYGDERVVRLMIAYIRHHYMESTLDLRTISDYVGYSTSYICPLFKKTVGVTINRFLTDTRLENARRLLESTEDSLEQIARACGYANAKYFGRAFKAAFKQSPGEYRQQGAHHGDRDGTEREKPAEPASVDAE